MTNENAEITAQCAKCRKPQALCVCQGLTAISNKIGVLILQHPQEQDVDLGTARLTALSLSNAVLKVGLSWPNLTKAWGRTADPKRWAVLYLGSASAAQALADREIVAVDKKGQAIDHQDAILSEIQGIILLDGSWSQAKAIWWRNPWLLKCRRIILAPQRPSRYGKLRKEPRREGLSTIEAAALVLSRLEGREEIESKLMGVFESLLAQYRSLKAKP
ncbi:MAG: tRNA-uridine aminocarboxypropyltransferase [Rhodospirillaceae bacterium]|nr:tRNA-uridine aminocarboxypropyltransferase [Rhodospirillaceae bacterium]